MSDYVFPQTNDYDDPENFAFHIGQSNLADFVEYGLSITADHANGDFDLSEGKAFVRQASAAGAASAETRHRLVYGVHLDARTNIGLATTSGVNYVWLDANVGSQDSPNIVVEANDSAPSDASLKIGVIDAANDTATELNRRPDLTVADLDVHQLASALDAAGYDITNAGAVSADSADITNAITSGSVSTGSGTVDGDEMVGFPATSSAITYTLGDGWTTADASRPVLLLVEASAETDGTNRGEVRVEVDESGGTATDYEIATAYVDASNPSGTTVFEAQTVPLPPAAQFRVVNVSDPNAANRISNIRKFVL